MRTLVTDSPAELSEAIERENASIARLLADGTLRADREGGEAGADREAGHGRGGGDDHEGRDGR